MIIYKIVSNINGKTYIGQTKFSLDKRIAQHIKDNKTPVQKAINKYGLESFEISIIDKADTRKELSEKEVYWIKELNSKAPDGYNLTDGGDGLINPTKETREKIGKASSIRNKGSIGWNTGLTKETDKRVAQQAEKLIGRKQTKESNDKRSNSLSGKSKSEEHKDNMKHPHIMSAEGIAAIALSNNDPERLKNASIRMTGDNNPAKRPEVRKKNSEAAKERAILGIGNADYFSTHIFKGKDNRNWKGGKKKVICANKNCGKTFEDRPNGDKKYCNRKCMGSDPERAKVISDKQKGKVFSDEHLSNIKIAQQKRRAEEKKQNQKENK
jgi:group I intron endonuclease